MKLPIVTLHLLVCLVLNPLKLSADILSVKGAVVLSSVPASTDEGQIEDDNEILIFQEQELLSLDTVFTVDAAESGFVDEESELTPLLISSPINVDTYLLHFDPIGNGPAEASGSVTFDVDIIGVIVLPSSLENSDSLLGDKDVVYPIDTASTNRGLELRGTDPTGDAFSLSSDFRTFTIERMAATGWVDQVRVVTFAKAVLLGDVNCDGEVNLLDVAPFIEAITSEYNIKADINEDGVVDLLDVAPFVDLLTGG